MNHSKFIRFICVATRYTINIVTGASLGLMACYGNKVLQVGASNTGWQPSHLPMTQELQDQFQTERL